MGMFRPGTPMGDRVHQNIAGKLRDRIAQPGGGDGFMGGVRRNVMRRFDERLQPQQPAAPQAQGLGAMFSSPSQQSLYGNARPTNEGRWP